MRRRCANTESSLLDSRGAPSPLLSRSISAVRRALCQRASCVALCARNGACTVQGGGNELIPANAGVTSLLYPMLRPCALGRSWCEHETDRRRKCCQVLTIELKSVSLFPGDAGKPRNRCQAGGLRYRIPRGMPRPDGASAPDRSGERVGETG